MVEANTESVSTRRLLLFIARLAISVAIILAALLYNHYVIEDGDPQVTLAIVTLIIIVVVLNVFFQPIKSIFGR